MHRRTLLAGLVLSTLLAAAPVRAQPEFVAEVNPGAPSATPRELRVFRGGLFFSATRPDVGRELFHFDGQHAALATDVAGASAAGSDPSTYVVQAGALYFVARTSAGHNGLWRFDGRTTDLIFAGGDVTYPVALHGGLYFAAPSTAGPRVWFWDGRDNYVEDAIPPSPHPVRHLTVFRGHLYFSYNDGTGRELWRSDGQRIERATDVNPATQETAGGVPLDFQAVRSYGGRLYFVAPDHSLYHFDGATATRVLGRARRTEWAGAHGGLVFFRTLSPASGGTYAPDTLWAYDGRQARPVLPLMGAARVEAGYDRQALVPFRGALYYRSALHLWRFTGSHFERVSDAAVRADAAPGGLMMPFRGRLYLAFPHLTDGNDELYRYNGTGPVYARTAALSSAPFNAALLDAEVAALEAGVDEAALTAADDRAAAPGFEAVLASASPARGAVHVRLTLPAAMPVRATVHDVLGRPVATLADGSYAAGATTLTWAGDGAAPGLYVVRVAAGSAVRTVPVVRTR
jgi:ELWxxDGT repeat protein